MLCVGGKYFKITHLNVRRGKKDTALILKCKRGEGSNPNSYSLTYFESIGTGTDGTFTGTDDSGTSFYGTGTGNEGTVALALMLLILAQSYHIFIDGF